MNHRSVSNDSPKADAIALCSDDALVALAKSGSHPAVAELCNRHKGMAFRIAYKITRNKEDAEDVVQDTSLKAFTHICSFDGRSSFSTWFTRIAMNSALMTLRKKRGRTYLSLEDDFIYPFQDLNPSSNPQFVLLEHEKEDLLRMAITRLPLALRNVTEIRHAQDMSVAEVAELAGISVAAAKSRLLRARRLLHRILYRSQRHIGPDFYKDNANRIVRGTFWLEASSTSSPPGSSATKPTTRTRSIARSGTTTTSR